MRKLMLLLVVALACSGVAAAQETPAVEVFGGYTYIIIKYLVYPDTTYSLQRSDSDAGAFQIDDEYRQPLVLRNSWVGSS